MNNRELFKQHCNSILLIGDRTNSVSLKDAIENESEREYYIKTFYRQCPRIDFLNETDARQYYILKRRWSIYRSYLVYKDLQANHVNKSKIYHLLNLICDIIEEPKVYRWYMNPRIDNRPKFRLRRLLMLYYTKY